MPELPRGIRNHNPGNIRRSADPWQGLAKDQNDAAFAQFAAAKWGIRALARTLIAYQDRHGLRTVRAIISRWAPPVENKTSSYIDHVAAQLGVSADEPLNVHDYRTLRGLVESIILHENGMQPYSAAELDAGLLLAGVAPPDKPLQSSRTIRGSQVAAGATAVSVAVETIRGLEPALPLAQRLIELAPFAAAAVALAGIAYVVWARIDDRRRGLR